MSREAGAPRSGDATRGESTLEADTRHQTLQCRCKEAEWREPGSRGPASEASGDATRGESTWEADTRNSHCTVGTKRPTVRRLHGQHKEAVDVSRGVEAAGGSPGINPASHC